MQPPRHAISGLPPPDASASCSTGVQITSFHAQRRDSSSLTTTSETASAITKSLLLDTLNLVRAWTLLPATLRVNVKVFLNSVYPQQVADPQLSLAAQYRCDALRKLVLPELRPNR